MGQPVLKPTSRFWNWGAILSCSGTGQGFWLGQNIYISIMLGCLLHTYMLSTAFELLYLTDPPSSPGTPSVAFLNLTTVEISWTAPWYPADSYILQIQNMTVGGSISYQTVNSTSLIETQGSSDGLCHPLEFTVQAVHSSLGNNFPSNGIISGFPKGLCDMTHSYASSA